MKQSNKKDNFKGNKQKGKTFNKERSNGREMSNFRREDKGVLASANSPSNDISWYAKDAQLLQATANIPYGYALGLDFDILRPSENVTYREEAVKKVPGIYQLNILPIPGVAQHAADPVNVAAAQLYSFVRHANSGSANYDVPDLMMHFLALDQIHMLYAWACRVYGVLRLSPADNRYFPDILLRSMNVNASDFRHHINDFWAYLTSFAAKLQSWFVPSDLPLFDRHRWLFGGLYCDDNTKKAQTYLFNPSHIYVYDGYKSKKGGQLTAQVLGDKADPWTFEELTTFMDRVIGSMYYDEDLGIMNGDILKAWGESNLIKIAAPPIDFTVVPVYDQEVLSQIENSFPIGRCYPNETNTSAYPVISQSNNIIKIGAYIRTEAPLHALNPILNSHFDEPKPGDNMIATRLVPVLQYVSQVNDTLILKVAHAGSELLTTVRVWTRLDGGFNWYDQPTAIINNDYESLVLRNLTAFDWHPAVYLFSRSSTEDTTTYTFDGYLKEIFNYTSVSQETLAKMHYCALISEFNIPGLSK